MNTISHGCHMKFVQGNKFFLFLFFPFSHWQRILRTTPTRRVSPTSMLPSGSTPRVGRRLKRVTLFLMSSVRWAASIFVLLTLKFGSKPTSTFPCCLCIPLLGRFKPGCQSEGVCPGTATETARTQPGHTVLPVPAGAPCGGQNLWANRRHWCSAYCYMAWWESLDQYWLYFARKYIWIMISFPFLLIYFDTKSSIYYSIDIELLFFFTSV